MALDRTANYRSAAERFEVLIPDAICSGQLDIQRIRTDSEFARRSYLNSYACFAIKYTATPGRNKDLFKVPTPGNTDLHSVTQQWNAIVREGVQANTSLPDRSPDRPITIPSTNTYKQSGTISQKGIRRSVTSSWKQIY
ncbi:unnamed protein product [Phytophthora lilii]|uniref:Unnamed protein product n=1 Tax=Phytophthora lilii TaxID=2077276 RepID=A0A9W6XBW1_9STRA|nr:unnamed protein product [Phytophthora lilii]